jgi:copper chaperone CopZ
MSTNAIIHSYAVTGMKCGACVNKISATLQNVAGVLAATVTLNPPEAHLEMQGHVSAAVLNDAIAHLGAYRLTEAQHRNSQAATTVEPTAEVPASLYPLFLIIGYIAVTVGMVAVSSGDHSIPVLMSNFMAGFFLVFSFFKLLDLRGFSDAYRSYDVLARAMPGWAFAYPFIELALGVAYLLRISPLLANVITLGLMSIASVGVLRALLDKRTIRCACLGTALKLPMTKVTLVEDLGMAVMAAAALATLVH